MPLTPPPTPICLCLSSRNQLIRSFSTDSFLPGTLETPVPPSETGWMAFRRGGRLVGDTAAPLSGETGNFYQMMSRGMTCARTQLSAV